MATESPPELELLWAFARGDISPEEFESILNASPNMKTHADLDLYVDLLSTNFSDARAVADRRYELRKHLDQLQRDEAWLKDRGLKSLDEWRARENA